MADPRTGRTCRDMFLDYADDVRAYLAHHVHPSDLDDAVSDVFTHAIAHFSVLRYPELAFLLAHSVTVAHAYHDAAASQDIPHGVHLAQAETSDDNTATAQALMELHEALNCLTVDERDVLGLAALGLAANEAAAILHISNPAYRVRLHRARTALARTLHTQDVPSRKDPA